MILPRVLICDIDGVLCDSSKRQKKYCDPSALLENDLDRWHKSLDGYSSTTEDDVPIYKGILLLRSLIPIFSIKRVLYLTARDELGFDLTLSWLQDNVDFKISRDDLFMRPHHDPRSPSHLKKDIILSLKEKFDIVFALDDHPGICDTYTSIGIDNLQVNYSSIDCLTHVGDPRMLHAR